MVVVVVVKSLSHVRLLVTPWTEAHQVSPFLTISQSLPESMSIELVMPSNHPPAMQGTPIHFLGQEDPLEKG